MLILFRQLANKTFTLRELEYFPCKFAVNNNIDLRYTSYRAKSKSITNIWVLKIALSAQMMCQVECCLGYNTTRLSYTRWYEPTGEHMLRLTEGELIWFYGNVSKVFKKYHNYPFQSHIIISFSIQLWVRKFKCRHL